VEILLIGLLCLFGAALVLHEVARLQQFAITLRSKDAPADALVFMGRLVRGGNAIALRWLETLWVRRNGARVCCFRAVGLPASGRSSLLRTHGR
jgi:hypothetical protein